MNLANDCGDINSVVSKKHQTNIKIIQQLFTVETVIFYTISKS